MPMLSRNLEKTLRRALALASARQHEFATLEHLLMALIDDDDAAVVLQACAVDVDRLRSILNDFLDHELTSLAVEGVVDAKPTAGFQRVVQRAALHVQSSGQSEVNGANVLVALFSERESHAVYFLQEQNMSRLDAVNYIGHGIAKQPGMTERRCVRGAEESEEARLSRSGAAHSIYGPRLETILGRALALADARRHAYATLDHLLMALTLDDEAAAVLAACAIEVDRLRARAADVLDHELTGLVVEATAEAKPTVAVQRVLLHAAMDGRRSPSSEAHGTAALLALLSERAIQARQGRLEGSCRVSLLGDDDTPTEFVIEVLERIFGRGREDAARIMLHVHADGVGDGGVYPYEIAETKVSEVVDYARRHHHPLRCTMAKD